MIDNFDADRIPDHVIHDAVNETLGNRKIQRMHKGYNFRCPICGDSKKNPNKKRGYVTYDSDKGWLYTCHNECGIMSFVFTFLKKYHINVYKKVMFYGFKKRKKIEKTEEKPTATRAYQAENVYKFKKGELVSIYDSHPIAKKGLEYCTSRKIREVVYSKWFVCLKDKRFFDRDKNGNTLHTEKGFPKGNEYANRIIIPYYRFGGKWKQFDGRAINEDAFLKYRNLENADRELYNIDFIDTNKPFFLLEGAIDSTFIRNAVAFGGTKHLRKFLGDFPELLKNAHNGTIIWDNDNAGYDEITSSSELGFNWFNWSSIKPSGKYKLDKNGNSRVIKDINNCVMYCDFCVFDEEGYIKYEWLKQFIEFPETARIKTQLLYGNRKKQRMEKLKEFFESKKKLSGSSSLNCRKT